VELSEAPTMLEGFPVRFDETDEPGVDGFLTIEDISPSE
jgi:hypothetical protein